MLIALTVLVALKENDLLITPQGHSKMALHLSFYNRKQNPWNLLVIMEA